MESALYYTLSTVSQTLAGALGMLAAFLVLRVAALDAAFNAGAAELERLTSQWGVQARHASAGEVIRYWHSQLAEAEGKGHHLAILAAAERAHASRRAVVVAARNAFVASAAVMAGCFVGLACSPWLGARVAVGAVVLLAAIVGALTCLFWYGRLVVRALD